MESLNFHFLVVEFLKHQEQLQQLGIAVEYLNGGSIYGDMLVVSRASFYHRMTMSFTSGRWDNLREFDMSDSMGRRWTHRLNPIDNQPVRVLNGGSNGMVGWLMTSGEMPVEVVTFGNQVLGMIQEIVSKIQLDQYNQRMAE